MLSFQNATLVLSIADKISEVHNCGMAREKQTLHVGLLADNSMFQICSDGIRHISVDMKIIQFTTDGSIQNLACVLVERSVDRSLRK